MYALFTKISTAKGKGFINTKEFCYFARRLCPVTIYRTCHQMINSGPS